MGWGGSQGLDRTERRCSSAFGVGLGVSQVTLGPRESLLVVAPGTGWGPSGGGEAEDEGWRGEEGGLGRCA